jgi:hypothetical protein
MRAFMNRSRRLADMGATVVVLHHDGKSETAKDFRGSSDFKASLDQAFHVTNVSSDMRLDRVKLRAFKSRYGFCGEVIYRYADGLFTRDERAHAPAMAVGEQLTELLRQHPGISGTNFEALATRRGIARQRARDFLDEGSLAGSINRTRGTCNTKKYELAEGLD